MSIIYLKIIHVINLTIYLTQPIGMFAFMEKNWNCNMKINHEIDDKIVFFFDLHNYGKINTFSFYVKSTLR